MADAIFVNEDDFNEGFWKHNFTIWLTVVGFKFVVNADSLQDALDTLIDWLDESGEWEGLIEREPFDEDGNEWPENWLSGGNHGYHIPTDYYYWCESD